jgi:serine/threonine protein kinase
MNEAHGPDPARPTTEFGARLQRFWAGLAPEEKRAIGRGPAVRLLAEGDVVGDWTVGGFVGRGGSAEVYCAHHRTLQKTAVLKVLHRTEYSQKERFRREARFLMGVPGPSFPAIFGVGELPDGRPWMALELLEEYPLPSKDADVARYLLDVAAGVAVLHARGYVHRDLKPANILRREAGGHAVLIDFGLIKSIDDSPVPVADGLSVADDGRAVGAGTPGYAAPELFGGGEVTPAVDVYALGMIADRCFGGHPPRAWTRIVAKATQSLPRLRYPGVEAFMRAVRHRHRRARLLFATAALAVAAGAVFFVNGMPPSSSGLRAMSDEEITEAFGTTPSAFRLMGTAQDRLRHWDLKGIRTDVDRALSRKRPEEAAPEFLLSAAWLLLTNPDSDFCDPALARKLYLQAGGDDAAPGSLRLAVKAALQFAEGDAPGALATLDGEKLPRESDPTSILLSLTGTIYPSDQKQAYADGFPYFLPHF